MARPAEHKALHPWVPFLALAYIALLSLSIFMRDRSLIVIALGLAVLVPLAFLFIFRLHLLGWITVFLIPLSVKIPVGGGSIVSFPAEALVLGIAVMYLIFVMKREHSVNVKVLAHPLSILILLDLLWSLFTGLTGEMPVVSLKRVLIKAIFIVVFYFLFLEMFRRRENLHRLWLVYVLGMIIPIVWTIYNHSNYDFNKVVSFLMPLPFFNDHTLYATCIAYILPVVALLGLRPEWFGMKRSYRHLFLGLVLLLLAGEYFSYSRAAWLSIATGLAAGALIAFLNFRAIHLLVLALIAGMAVSYYSNEIYSHIEKVDAMSRDEDVGEHMRSVMNIQTDASNLERINRWQCALRMYNDMPVTGFGPGTYMFVYGRYQVTTEMTRISTNHGEKGNAHSEYLMYLSETGLPGLIIFLLLIYITIAKAIRIFHRARAPGVRWLALAILVGFISYLFHGNFNSFIDTDKASVLFYGTMAFVAGVELYHRDRVQRQ